jgi:hydroxymethylbilane synthase
LAKLDRGDVGATLLACAGLNRLGLGHRITAPIAVEDMLPAVAQGAIGIEIRAGEERLARLLDPVNHHPTEVVVGCERAFLGALEGSCRTPIAGHARLEGEVLHFRGEALTPDGAFSFAVELAGGANDALRLGREAGIEVKRKGGAKLMLAG